MALHGFMRRFSFDPSKAGWLGVEREAFIQTTDGALVPEASRVLSALRAHDPNRFGFELSACQIESRTRPCCVDELLDELRANDDALNVALSSLGLMANHHEVGPVDMPLDVFPDPTGRYQRIVEQMSPEVRMAACRIIGTHVHVGMPDHETALRVYNDVVQHVPRLCDLGDGSGGERLAIYRTVNPDCMPRPYGSWSEFHGVALAEGFADDPRNCWTLVRVSKHGTLEFRMFGTTQYVEMVYEWARECHRVCMEVME